MAKDNGEQLASLLLKWEEAWDLGEDIPAGELCADCPELTQKLNDQIKILKSMNWMKRDAADDLDDSSEVDLLIGRTLAGRYRIDFLVGFGGHGKVYKAYDPELQRDVAIKVSRTFASDNQSEELLEEARRAAKLKHPNIVAVYDVGRHDGQLFFVTELVEGKNLADIIADSKPSITEAKRIVVSVAEALQFAHQQGFLHRDIKPANILLDKNGRVLVTDFGIATTIDRIENHRGGTPGTLPYMAPEQVAGEVQLIDGRTDIHALGVVLYELLTGQLPYQGRTPTAVREQILLRQPKPLLAIDNSIPKSLEAVCLKCLAKHPADRYETTTAAIEAISSVQSQSTKHVPWFMGIIVLSLLSVVVWQASGFQSPVSDPAKNTSTESDGSFRFDGNHRIVTPIRRFAPVTIEAWVYPTTKDLECHFIVGSDTASEFGIGIGICGTMLTAEVVPSLIKSNAIVQPFRWSHVAGVFGETETRLYLNGSLIHTGPATEDVTDKTHFVIGNVGENNPIDYFEGKIRAIRITDGERFTTDFPPDESFMTADQETNNRVVQLLYDGSHISGKAVLDLSGKNNHGRWESLLK